MASAQRVEFCEGDLWGTCSRAPIRLHHFPIPPVTSEEYAGLDREVAILNHVWPWKQVLPHGVLSRIAQQAPQFLHANGSVLCEISPMLRDATQKNLPSGDRTDRCVDHQRPRATGARDRARAIGSRMDERVHRTQTGARTQCTNHADESCDGLSGARGIDVRVDLRVAILAWPNISCTWCAGLPHPASRCVAKLCRSVMGNLHRL